MQKVSRLYPLFHPESYTLMINPNKTTMTFEGSVAIVGEIQKKGNIIRLHSKDLNITKVVVNETECEFTLDAKNDEIRIVHPQKKKGVVALFITFNGLITRPMHGIYPCFAHNGDIILATQFESHHAREMFPCVDEPEAKAVFQLTLHAPHTDVVLSNTDAKKTVQQGTSQIITFAETPKMSTYVLAFVSGPLVHVTGKTKSGVRVGVYAHTGHDKHALQFALTTSIKVTEFFEKYFDVKYPLAKCDHVALPDFSSGAMENWGLITYREICLLVDEKTASLVAKEYAALVIAHEISHQWFGNLVTMKWWDDLWLNESFATLMEYIAVDAVYPEWDVMTTFTAHEALSALQRDSVLDVQPIVCDVTHPDQIHGLFDPAIVYAKGSRVLLMVMRFVGERAFQKGLKAYFNTHMYGNTIGNDLWIELEKASKKKVRQFVKSWLEQPGFPMLSVNQQGAKITLTQRRFLKGKEVAIAKNVAYTIPFQANRKLPITTMKSRRQVVHTKNPKTWVRFNTEGGHYTVQYVQREHKAYIHASIANGEATTIEKIMILNDALMQAHAGVSSIANMLDVLCSLQVEEKHAIWQVVQRCIAASHAHVEDDQVFEKHLKQFVSELVRKHYKKLTTKEKAHEPENLKKLRAIIVALGVYSEDEDIITDVLGMYRSYTNVESMPSLIRHSLLKAGIRHGEKEIFDQLVNAYPHTKNQEIKNDIKGALASTHNTEQIKLLLNKLVLYDFVKLQDVSSWIASLLANKHARVDTWEWMKENWDWIETNFAGDKTIDQFPRHAGATFANSKLLNEYKAFFTPKKKKKALEKNIVIGINEIDARLAWIKRDKELLNAWFQKRHEL